MVAKVAKLVKQQQPPPSLVLSSPQETIEDSDAVSSYCEAAAYRLVIPIHGLLKPISRAKLASDTRGARRGYRGAPNRWSSAANGSTFYFNNKIRNRIRIANRDLFPMQAIMMDRRFDCDPKQ
ncbi:uncharacterized protein UDID_17701 [Ustilago sp. UG-2017a]|nr:uncharacterized protein UDID_17701 [Ustilago sp. UG-2017a]